MASEILTDSTSEGIGETEKTNKWSNEKESADGAAGHILLEANGGVFSQMELSSQLMFLSNFSLLMTGNRKIGGKYQLCPSSLRSTA